MTLAVARVHPIEIGPEQRGLFPTLAGADLDDDVLLVERIPWYELGAQLRCELVGLRREIGDLLACEIAQVRVIAVDELPRLREL